MKVIVSELPVRSKDCIFAEYINMTSKYKCMFQSGMYSRCKLDCGEECPYLKRGSRRALHFGGTGDRRVAGYWG